MSAGTTWVGVPQVTFASGRERFVPAAMNSEKYTVALGILMSGTMDAHEDWKSWSESHAKAAYAFSDRNPND